MTNGEIEVRNTLIAILVELQKINKHLDRTFQVRPEPMRITEYNLHPPYTIT